MTIIIIIIIIVVVVVVVVIIIIIIITIVIVDPIIAPGSWASPYHVVPAGYIVIIILVGTTRKTARPCIDGGVTCCSNSTC